MNNFIFSIIKISRPRFWLYLFGPFVIGYTAGLSLISDVYYLEYIVFSIYFLFIANFLLYGVNDYFDEETDVLNAKKENKEYRLKSSDKKALKISLIISLGLSMLLFYFLDLLSGTVLLVFLFLSIFYSAPPLRFKNIPIIDGLSNSLYFLPGIIGFLLTSNIFPGINIFLIGITWTAAMHLFSAIPDIDVDKKARINTTATVLGYQKALILCFIYWTFFAVLIIYNNYFGTLGYISLLYPIIPLYLLLFSKYDINKIYWKFPYINGILGFSIYLTILVNKLS